MIVLDTNVLSVRADLLRAGATVMKVSLEDVRRQLAASDPDGEGEE